MKTKVKEFLEDSLFRQPALEVCRNQIICAFELMNDCYRREGTILVCGNGGSAADSEHIVGELMNKFMLKRPIPEELAQKLKAMNDNGDYLSSHLQQAIRSICLVSQTATTTAIANDIGADMVFAQQVYGYGKNGDLLIAISTSGNSQNVINAVKVARAIGMKVIGFTGESSGAMGSLCDCLIAAPSKITYKAQEMHLTVYHALCAMVEHEIFGV